MSDDKQRCSALTRVGKPCKNNARPGSTYCHVHQPMPSEPSGEQTEFDELVAELNELADELRAKIPSYQPPPFSPQGLVKLIKANVHRMTPEAALNLVTTLQEGMQDAKPEDFLEPDTWKGMWFLLNYSIQSETEGLRENLAQQLSGLPGAGTVAELRGMFEGAQPKDFLEVDTWKGMWFLLNYTVQSRIEEMKEKVRGGEE